MEATNDFRNKMEEEAAGFVSTLSCGVQISPSSDESDEAVMPDANTNRGNGSSQRCRCGNCLQMKNENENLCCQDVPGLTCRGCLAETYNFSTRFLPNRVSFTHPKQKAVTNDKLRRACYKGLQSDSTERWAKDTGRLFRLASSGESDRHT